MGNIVVELKHPPISNPFPIFTVDKYKGPTPTITKIMSPPAQPPKSHQDFNMWNSKPQTTTENQSLTRQG